MWATRCQITLDLVLLKDTYDGKRTVHVVFYYEYHCFFVDIVKFCFFSFIAFHSDGLTDWYMFQGFFSTIAILKVVLVFLLFFFIVIILDNDLLFDVSDCTALDQSCFLLIILLFKLLYIFLLHFGFFASEVLDRILH